MRRYGIFTLEDTRYGAPLTTYFPFVEWVDTAGVVLVRMYVGPQASLTGLYGTEITYYVKHEAEDALRRWIDANPVEADTTPIEGIAFFL
jgi:hypothetical protein